MILQQLKIAEKNSLDDINALLPQLSSSAKKLSLYDLRKIVKDRNTLLLVWRDRGRIVGMGLVVFILTPIGLRARMEDVVIDGYYQGKGLGRKLTSRLIQEAKRRKSRWIEFTSRADRTATNRFYQRLGFQKRDANVYRLQF